MTGNFRGCSSDMLAFTCSRLRAPLTCHASPTAPPPYCPSSHAVFIVTVSVREVTPEGDEVIRVGKLYLVDLAGSENITR